MLNAMGMEKISKNADLLFIGPFFHFIYNVSKVMVIMNDISKVLYEVGNEWCHPCASTFIRRDAFAFGLV